MKSLNHVLLWRFVGISLCLCITACGPRPIEQELLEIAAEESSSNTGGSSDDTSTPAEDADSDSSPEDVPPEEPPPPPPVPQSTVLSVPYFYQYSNAYEPSATCGLTSAAMILNFWDSGSVNPDSLYTSYGKAQGQSPGGLAQLYRWEGFYADHSYNASRNDIKGHIDAGRPVVVHGNWTGSGHVAVIIGYDARGWISNDPAGDWEVCYGCGFGNRVHYAFGGGWDQRLSYDGDIWLSVASSYPF